MTIIAYDHKNKIIAYDSRETDGNRICADNCDKKVIKGNRVWFAAGDSADIDRFIEEFEPYKQCGFNLNVNAFFVENGVAKQACLVDGFFKCYNLNGNEAVGSGAPFAISAMDFGKTAFQSVEYAKTKDIYTGGKVNEYHIDQGK